jgi:alcohol oxidase
VLFDNSSLPRAVGVEYTSSTPTSSTFHTIKANKLVIVSAGALGTPQILERSGVGSAELLSKLNIPVISDLPGVGENYQDHTRIMYPYFSSLRPDQTLEKLYRGTAEEFAKAVEEKNPMLGWNGIGGSSLLFLILFF